MDSPIWGIKISVGMGTSFSGQLMRVAGNCRLYGRGNRVGAGTGG